MVLMIAGLITADVSCHMVFRVSFELEPGSTGQTTDFREANKKLEWSLKKVIFLIISTVF